MYDSDTDIMITLLFKQQSICLFNHMKLDLIKFLNLNIQFIYFSKLKSTIFVYWPLIQHRLLSF